MKILHINNIANVAVQLRDAQRFLGHQVIVATTKEDPTILNFPEDIRFNPSISKAAFAVQLFSLIRWADIVHLHSLVWPSLIRLMKPIRKFLSIPIVAHYHGSDVRSGAWKKSSRLADAIILSTPDLQTGCPDGVYIPNPYADPGIQVSYSNPQLIRVVHAYSNDRGVQTIREIVGQVDGAELVEVTRLPHSEALSIYSTCNIAIDQFMFGWYGLFAIECMMMGIPTVGWIDTRYAGNPIYHADEQNAVWALRSLVGNPDERERIGLRQQAHVKQVHDPMKIAKEVLNIYSKLLGESEITWVPDPIDTPTRL